MKELQEIILRNQAIYKPNKIYLNSYRPLCMTEIGRKAVIKYNHPPFIDASCRREPDLENTFPTISSICRQGLFAPRLRERDIVVYLSVKQKYYNDHESNNKLIAILQVDKVFNTHQKGYDWFKENNLKIPSNCMVENNPPYDFDHTGSNFESSKKIKNYLSKNEEEQIRQGYLILNLWDNSYRDKTEKWKMFIKTIPLYVELNNPIALFKADMANIFGIKIPNTRNPPQISFTQLEKLALIAGIKLTIE